MDREHVYKYLRTESAREKYMDVHLRHLTSPQKNPGDLFTLLTKLPVDCDSRNVPLLTWNHILNIMRDAYGIVPGTEHNIVLLKQPRMEIPVHTHTYFELIYVLSGTSVHYINQNAETFSEGDFCILPPPVRHSQISCPDGLAVSIHRRIPFPERLSVPAAYPVRSPCPSSAGKQASAADICRCLPRCAHIRLL